jgi:inhibitor of cysteine peptidase
MILVDETWAGRTLDLPVGQAVELRLKENPTAGFVWRITQSGAPSCRVAEDAFEPPAQAIPGQPGQHRWRIEGVASGICTLAFAYGRPWEADRPAATTYALTIRVGM